jgi:hypothetical protein
MHTCHRVLQAFGERHLVRRQLGVAQVAALAAWVCCIQRWRRRVVTAAPDQHLFVAVLLGHVGLVQALQRAIVAFVQPPVVLHWQPGALHFVQRVPQRPHGALEHGRVRHVKFVAALAQQAPGLAGLRHPGVGERDIGPAGETVLEVPGGFPVADEDEFVHGVNSIIRGFAQCRRLP